MSAVEIGVSGTIVAVKILIEIFFCCFLINRDLVISLSFFYENSAFICFLERLKDYYFVLGEICIILLRLDSFLDNKDSVLDSLLLLSLLLYFSSILVALLIIIIFVVFEIFSFFEKALA